MNVSDHKTCLDILGQVNAYIDGELDPTLCRHLEAHIDTCADCRVVFETLKKTIELCQKNVKQATLPQNIKKRVFDVIAAEDVTPEEK